MDPQPARAPDPVPGGGLLHPVPLLALVLLVVNDHWLKDAFGAPWTGKLSDVAGLAFFPLLLQGGVEWVQARLGRFAPSRRLLLACAAITGIGFALIQLWEPAGAVWRVGLAALQWPFRALVGIALGRGIPALGRAHLTPDPTDLWALPALLLAVAAGWRRTDPQGDRRG